MIYHEVLPQQFFIAEASQFIWRSAEEDLVQWWLRQSEKMDKLQTMDGEHLIVLDAGRRNDGSGPDIFRSRIILDGIEMSGEVEMHTRAADWFAHGHQDDNRYRDVILHIIVEGNQGPDIPTVKVDRHWLGASRCVAFRSVTQAELVGHSFARFRQKEQHLKILSQQGNGYSPLLLGMIEIIMAGASRRKLLQHSASLLGLKKWPDCRNWEGSNQSFPIVKSKEVLLTAIKHNFHLFHAEPWRSIRQNSWSAWDEKFAPFRKIGISHNQSREWLVNILAPLMGGEIGFWLWQNLKIFRHYGLEKKMLSRLGLPKIRTIAEQQGILSWQNNYCSPWSCNICPLTQCHHTLTHIN